MAPAVPGYELLEVLGHGGMGVVYRARHRGLRREVALKLLRTRKPSDTARPRFVREAEVMARVRHANLVQVYDAGAAGDDLWIAMELVRGPSLAAVLAQAGPLPPPRAREVWLAVAGALEALHRERVLHRDVKPGNVVLEQGGRAVLMDLGLARDEDRTGVTATGNLLGTPMYLSPELLVGGDWSPGDDFYALGLSWWETLSGRRAFEWDEILEALRRGRTWTLPEVASPHGPVPTPDRELLRALTGPRARRPTSLAALEDSFDSPPGNTTLALPPLRPGPGGDDASSSQGARPPAAARGAARAVRRAALSLAGTLGLAGLAWWALPQGPGSPASAPAPAPASPLRVVATWSDRHGFLLEGEAPDVASVRATRNMGRRAVPVPVYARGGDRFYVWVAGLAPGSRGLLYLERADQTPLATVEYHALAPGSPPPEAGAPYPFLFRNLRSLEDDRTLTRELAGMRAVVAVEGLIDFEDQATTGMAQFNRVSGPAWSALLAWMEEEGPAATNLIRMLRFAEPPVPPAVTWHLVHRLADGETGPGRAGGADLWMDPFEGSFVPPALFPRLLEWQARGLAGGSPYRLGLDSARTLAAYPRHVPFPESIPGWDGEFAGARPRDPLADLGNDPLSALVIDAVRARRGHAEAARALVVASARPGASGRWATALLPLTGDPEQIDPLLDRFGTAEGEELWAVATALRGFQTDIGMWTPRNQVVLVRGPAPPWPVTGVEAPPDTRVVVRDRAGAFFARGPGTGFEVALVGGEGRRARFHVDATSGVRRRPAP